MHEVFTLCAQRKASKESKSIEKQGGKLVKEQNIDIVFKNNLVQIVSDLVTNRLWQFYQSYFKISFFILK